MWITITTKTRDTKPEADYLDFNQIRLHIGEATMHITVDDAKVLYSELQDALYQAYTEEMHNEEMGA
jgi:hypothetical protein